MAGAGADRTRTSSSSSGEKDLSTYGFLGYPLLQSADIMVYKAAAVPVGEDQAPHIELTREVVRRFNNFYGPVFPEPKTLLTATPRTPGTDGRKMSKSYGNAILLKDTPEAVRAKLKTMVTDPARVRRTDPGNPDVCPVFDLHKAFSTQETQEWAAAGCRTAGIGCIDCKGRLADHVMERMAGIHAAPGRVRRPARHGVGRPARRQPPRARGRGRHHGGRAARR